MRRSLMSPVLFGVAGALFLGADTPKAQAQDVKPIEQQFTTADGVQLHGLFTKSSSKKPSADPVVILLYPPGKDNTMAKGDWKGLATLLSREGYNVFQFDWRGHGKSTDIKDPARFWNIKRPGDEYDPNPFCGAWNCPKLIRGAPTAFTKGKIKNTIFYKDLIDPVKYISMYLIDLAAARHHLDGLNDADDVNMSSVYLVGADITASIGLGWIATEWQRPGFRPTAQLLPAVPGAFPAYKYVPQPQYGGLPDERGGGDISGAVWLSPVQPASIPEAVIRGWMKATPELREKNPMLFLRGPNDLKEKRQASYFVDEVLVAKPPTGSPLKKLEQTYAVEVKGSGTPSGGELLGANLGTEATIVNYLNGLQKDRAMLIRKVRGLTAPWSIQLAHDENLAGAGFGFERP